MITRFTVKDLKHAALAGFCQDVLRLIKSRMAEGELSSSHDFEAAIEAFNAELRKSSETYGDQILEADNAADHAWSVMNAQINVLSEHLRADVREAALTLKAVFAKYNNPTGLPYVEEYAILNNLLTDLDEVSSDVYDKTMLTEWKAELRARVSAFNDLMQNKTQSKALVEVGATKRARSALECAYKALVSQLNAILVLAPSEAHDALVNDINAMIAGHKATAKAQKTVKAASAAKE